MVRPIFSRRLNSSQFDQCPTRLELASSTRGDSGCVRKMPTGRPDCTSSVSSLASDSSARTMAWKLGQSRAARPVPPYTISSSGFSATSGSRLLCSMRRAASWCHPWQRRVAPRGAWIAVIRLIGALRPGHITTPESPIHRTCPGGWRGRRFRYRWRAGGLRRAAARCRGYDRARRGVRGRGRMVPGSAKSGGERAVCAERRRDVADTIAHAAKFGAGVESYAVAQGFGGRQQLDGGDVLTVLHDGAQLEGSVHAHGNMVLLAAGGGHVIDARGMGQHFALVEQRDGGDVGHHEAAAEAGMGGEKGGESLVEVGIDQAIDAAFGDAGEGGEGDGGGIETGRAHV